MLLTQISHHKLYFFYIIQNVFIVSIYCITTAAWHKSILYGGKLKWNSALKGVYLWESGCSWSWHQTRKWCINVPIKNSCVFSPCQVLNTSLLPNSLEEQHQWRLPRTSSARLIYLWATLTCKHSWSESRPSANYLVIPVQPSFFFCSA